MLLYHGLRRREMSRISKLFEAFDNKNRNCLYLMNKSFRVNNNYSLDTAIKLCSEYGMSLKIIILEPFELNQKNLEFFHEITDDLADVLKDFSNDIINLKRTDDIFKHLEKTYAIVVDKSYLKFDIEYFQKIKHYAFNNDISLYEVESNVFVPIMESSKKEEYSARTIRTKINALIDDYQTEVLTDFFGSKAYNKALGILEDFIINKLDDYHLHNDPSLDKTSLLSPYLKYGFISPVTIYNRLKNVVSDNKAAFLEELIVRRELAYNFVYYNPTYDNFDYMTYDWAYQTMNNHIKDRRDYLYSEIDYLKFNTHDKYFNAAMKEMVYLGRMHSYMRMYWCKKIIEWSRTYEEAFYLALKLNDYYFLDGLTPNGYCGVAWCFGKHDRAWTERKIFGKLRYMNASGLERKFNIENYVIQMDEIEKERLR